MNKVLLILLFFAVSYSAFSGLNVVGKFEGWGDNVVVELTDGTCWKQAYNFHYRFVINYPTVERYKKGGSTFLKVYGCPEMQVIQVNCNSNSNNNTNDRSYSASYNTNNQPTYLKVQNNTNYTLYFCYAIYDFSNGWVSRGWYKADAYSSSSANLGFYSGTVYMYAQDSNNEHIWSDENSLYSFCIHKTDGFEIQNSASVDCSNSNYKRVKMYKYDVSPGAFTWTLNP
jgi:uncharacterized membrane protein